MSTVYEKLAENFARWEMRGRGVMIFPEPVSPRPSFTPFPGHRLPVAPQPDSGRRPTFLSRLTDRVTHAIRPPTGRALAVVEHEPEEPQPDWLGKEVPDLVELALLLPLDFTAGPEAMAHFLSSVSLASHPLTLEFIGTQGRVALATLRAPGGCGHFGGANGRAFSSSSPKRRRKRADVQGD